MGELAQVMADQVQHPLALCAVEATEPEEAGALADLHLPNRGLLIRHRSFRTTSGAMSQSVENADAAAAVGPPQLRVLALWAWQSLW